MKRFLVMTAILISFFMVSAVSAETYKVRSGDTLSKIAQKYPGVSWKNIFEANRNQISNPNLIRIGQNLVIPANNASPQVKPGPRYWKNPGGDPFGSERDKAKAIMMFSLPEEVKKEAIRKLEEKDWHYFVTKSGDKFEEMFFGNYKKWSDVIAAWPDFKQYAGRRVQVDHSGKIYHIAFPFICHNISWWVEDKPVPVVKKEIPTPVPISEASPETVVAEEPEKYGMDYDIYAWAGRFEALKGKGYSNFYGGKANLWYLIHPTSFGLLKHGLSATYNGWDGKSDDRFSFDGERYTLGPIISWVREDTSETSLSVQFGRQKDAGHTADRNYRQTQRTDIVHVSITHDTYPETSYVDKLEMWADANFDIGHKKSSAWQGSKIPTQDDPAGDKTSFGTGLNAYLWKTEKVKGGITLKADHAVEDHHLGVNVGPFITDVGEHIKGSLEFRNVSNSKYSDNNGDSIGVVVSVDLGKVFKKIARSMKK